MVVPASNSLLMVPGPESNKSLDWPTSINTEQELRFSDGTHVPEPKMVTVNPEFSKTIIDELPAS